MILVITYDLKTTKDYTQFYEAVKRQGRWWHFLASTWLVFTSASVDDVVKAVRPFMDQQDSLFVTEMGPHYQGQLPQEAWDWIKDHQKASSIVYYKDVMLRTAKAKAKARDPLVGDHSPKPAGPIDPFLPGPPQPIDPFSPEPAKSSDWSPPVPGGDKK